MESIEESDGGKVSHDLDFSETVFALFVSSPPVMVANFNNSSCPILVQVDTTFNLDRMHEIQNARFGNSNKCTLKPLVVP